MPVRRTTRGARIAIKAETDRTLKPGQHLTTDTTFLAAAPGDHFVPLQRYRDYMADISLRAPDAPDSAFEPIWCAWGYERDFTVDQVIGTLPKVREVGLHWAVLDDGWQTNEGDWDLNPQKFPQGETDMRAFTKQIRDAGLRPRLWWAPLAADPGSNLFTGHPDMLLLDRDGNKQEVTWWDAYTLCPAYQPTVDYFVRQAKKFIGDWGYEGLKIDGQHLNGVTPATTRPTGTPGPKNRPKAWPASGRRSTKPHIRRTRTPSSNCAPAARPSPSTTCPTSTSTRRRTRSRPTRSGPRARR